MHILATIRPLHKGLSLWPHPGQHDSFRVHTQHTVYPLTPGCASVTDFSFQIDTLPDTGTSKTLLSWDIIQAHNLSEHKSNATTVFAANNTKMILHGTVNIVIMPWH